MQLCIYLKGNVECSQWLESDAEKHEICLHFWVTEVICNASDLGAFLYLFMAYKVGL